MKKNEKLKAVTLQLRVTEQMKTDLEAIAALELESVSTILRRAVLRYLKEEGLLEDMESAGEALRAARETLGKGGKAKTRKEA